MALPRGRGGMALPRGRGEPSPGRRPARARLRGDRSVGAADPGGGCELRCHLRRSGARAHGWDRRGARVRRRGASRAAAGRRAVRRRSRLPEGACLLLGHRLHTQLRHHRSACAATAVRRRVRDRRYRPEHRCGDRPPARRTRGRRAPGQPLPGVDAVSRWTRTEELLFRVRKNLFETLAFVARRPAA